MSHRYMTKHGAALRKKHKSTPTFRLLKEKAAATLPSRDDIRRQCRQLVWNLDYWCNALRNIHINPYEVLAGESYYGYADGGYAERVSRRQRPVDEMYVVWVKKN